MSDSNDSLFNNTEQEEKVNTAEETPTQEENTTTPETDGGQQEQQVSSNAFDQLLAGITSADGRQKYSSVEDALKSLPHAQSHISQLEDDNKQLKSQMEQMQEQLSKMSKYEELLANQQASQGNQNDNSGGGLDEAKIAQLVQQQMTAAEKQKSAQQNAQTVVKELSELFGDQQAASKAFAEKARELEVDESFLSDMARRSPKAVLSYFSTNQTKTPKSTQSDVNTTSFQSKPEQPKGKLYGKTSDLIANWRASAESVNSKRNQ